MVNELDYILLLIVLLAVIVGVRRGLIRVLLSMVGIFITVVVAGYAYEPIGSILADGLLRLEVRVSAVTAHSITFVVLVIAMTALVETLSRMTFEETRLRKAPILDSLFGGIAGIFYGALWAALFLVPPQYVVSHSQSGGAWVAALNGSVLVPVLNRMFQTVVLDVTSILFLGGIPQLYLNSFSTRLVELWLALL